MQLPLGVAEVRGQPGDAAPSTSPSAISRIARATTSARASHSGEPGAASGRQRRQARYPAPCAAAAVVKKETLRASGVRAGHDGRQ